MFGQIGHGLCACGIDAEFGFKGSFGLPRIFAVPVVEIGRDRNYHLVRGGAGFGGGAAKMSGYGLDGAGRCRRRVLRCRHVGGRRKSGIGVENSGRKTRERASFVLLCRQATLWPTGTR